MQKSYIEVPGTVFMTAQEMYQNYCSSYHTDVSKAVFQQIVRKIFGNIKIVRNNATIKYIGLRPNFLDDKPCTSVEIAEIANMLGYFPMTTGKCTDTSRFGLPTGYCVNRNEILKVVEIQPDKSYKLSVGGRDVNAQEIGLEGVTMDTHFSVRIVFNTFKQCTVCQGKSVDSKTDAKKFSVVQEWCQKGDENSLMLRLTARKCHGVIPFTTRSVTCGSCSKQRTPDPPLQNTESTEDLFKRLFPSANDLMLNFLQLQSQMSCDDTDKRNRKWNKEIIQVSFCINHQKLTLYRQKHSFKPFVSSLLQTWYILIKEPLSICFLRVYTACQI